MNVKNVGNIGRRLTVVSLGWTLMVAVVAEVDQVGGKSGRVDMLCGGGVCLWREQWKFWWTNDQP